MTTARRIEAGCGSSRKSFRRSRTRWLGDSPATRCPDNLYAVASHTILDVVNAHYNHDHQRCTFFPSNNMAMRRRNFLEIGGFDPGFRCSEDRDLCDRWSARGLNLIFAPDAVVEHTRAMGSGISANNTSATAGGHGDFIACVNGAARES